jgi:hypothetical protein
MKSSLTTSVQTLPKKTSFQSTTTTWQRQATSNQSTPLGSDRSREKTPMDDPQLNQEYLAVKMQLEMKKRSIERDKQRLESERDSKRQTISQEAFKQLLQQKTRTSSKLSNEYRLSKMPPADIQHQIRKSQTTTNISLSKPVVSVPTEVASKVSRQDESSSLLDLSKPMSRDEFLNTLELLKRRYIETQTPEVHVPVDDQTHRIEQLNCNIGELQQVKQTCR